MIASNKKSETYYPKQYIISPEYYCSLFRSVVIHKIFKRSARNTIMINKKFEYEFKTDFIAIFSDVIINSMFNTEFNA